MVTLALLLGIASPTITRSDYGVPQISGRNITEVFRNLGYATAQDRLWQMENSRRVARGEMAEVFGPTLVASDKETRKTLVSDAEIDAQFAKRGKNFQSAWKAFAEGVNAYIADAKKEKELPEGYKKNGFLPRPWTVNDSASIAVMMGRRFGQTGGYELAQWTALQYLGTQKVKDRRLDAWEDFAWQNDPKAYTTVQAEDEAQCKQLEFPQWTRGDTEKQLDGLPKVGLLELAPALKLAMAEEQQTVAVKSGTPYKLGSYAMVVAGNRSASGKPILLSGPQMGLSDPAIVYEVVIRSRGMNVAGISVPGVPMVVVGSTPKIAWGLTTGVADTSDIFWNETKDETYRYGTDWLSLKHIRHTIKVKDGANAEVDQVRTRFGDVLLENARTHSVFSLRRSGDGKELESWEALFDLYSVQSVSDAIKKAPKIAFNFNLFLADKKTIGWTYCGLMPLRANGYDARLPIPGEPETDWKGFQSLSEHLHVVDPKGGLFVNWNNKPISWFPCLDTPYWGYPNRVNLIADAFRTRDMIVPDKLWNTSKLIAQEDDYSAGVMLGELKAVIPADDELQHFDGLMVLNSRPARLFSIFLTTLKNMLVADDTGNFLSPATFNTVAQAPFVLKALEGKTRFDFLNGDSKRSFLLKAYEAAKNQYATMNSDIFIPSSATYAGADPLMYSNRGSFIQVAQFGDRLVVDSVLPPGNSEAGDHSRDQLPIAREFHGKRLVSWDAR
ncbi:MAG: penicillin acylase family protein [Armatimonadetes bacterium]|nr:penicillin acylase family protein [Armatimonadota bacterium]